MPRSQPELSRLETHSDRGKSAHARQDFQTDNTANQHDGSRSGVEDLLEAAGYASCSNKESPSSNWWPVDL